MPLHATAMGKAFLAAMDDAQVRALLSGEPLERLTPRTITDMDTLLAQLAQIRERGWALEAEENTENVCCVGVSVLDRDGQPAYALRLSAPSFRVREALLQRYGALLMQAKRRIERVLRAL